MLLSSFKSVTQGIQVEVVPFYRSDESDIINLQFVYSYYINIKNNSSQNVQLLDRYWEIKDSTGNIKVVEGAGVIGKQPIIKIGEMYSYNSYAVLKTMTGTMKGYYTMLNEEDEKIMVKIPEFRLQSIQVN
jgi:ApaG protein